MLRSALGLCLVVLTAAGQPPPGGGGTAGTQCATDGSQYQYTESISSDGATRTITTSYCPNHPFMNINPNYPVVATGSTYSVPAKPIYDTSKQYNLREKGGSVGVFFSGAQVYSPYGGPTYGAVSNQATSATANEGDTFDMCGCHASSTSNPSYHCHIAPPCLLQQLGQTSTSHSPQIGWAGDGFPIYGPRGVDGVIMQTCTVTGGSFGTDVCTDDCGGYLKTDPAIDEFTYRYYTIGATNDGLQCSKIADTTPYPGSQQSTYPNTPVCYNGCCPPGATCSLGLTACGTGGTAGFTSSSAAGTVKYPTGLATNCAACWTSGESGALPPACGGPAPSPGPSSAPGSSSAVHLIPAVWSSLAVVLLLATVMM